MLPVSSILPAVSVEFITSEYDPIPRITEEEADTGELVTLVNLVVVVHNSTG